MSIPFICPHCGANSSVDEKFVGTSGPCGSCGKTITIGGLDAAGPAPASTGGGSKGSGTIIAVVLIVALVFVVVVVGVLALLLFPAVSAVREAARRNQCANNVRQISYAMLNYAAEHGSFPPAYVPDEDGHPMHSWRVLILPYLDETTLYEQYDFSKPWDSPENLEVAAQMPQVYRCLSAEDQQSGGANYMVVTGPQMLFQGGKPPKSEEIQDGSSRTILVAETSGSTAGWTEPVDLDASQMTFQINGGPGEIGSDHRGGVVVVGYADGHTSVLTEDLDPEQVCPVYAQRRRIG